MVFAFNTRRRPFFWGVLATSLMVFGPAIKTTWGSTTTIKLDKKELSDAASRALGPGSLLNAVGKALPTESIDPRWPVLRISTNPSNVVAKPEGCVEMTPAGKQTPGRAVAKTKQIPCPEGAGEWNLNNNSSDSLKDGPYEEEPRLRQERSLPPVTDVGQRLAAETAMQPACYPVKRSVLFGLFEREELVCPDMEGGPVYRSGSYSSSGYSPGWHGGISTPSINVPDVNVHVPQIHIPTPHIPVTPGKPPMEDRGNPNYDTHNGHGIVTYTDPDRGTPVTTPTWSGYPNTHNHGKGNTSIEYNSSFSEQESIRQRGPGFRFSQDSAASGSTFLKVTPRSFEKRDKGAEIFRQNIKTPHFSQSVSRRSKFSESLKVRKVGPLTLGSSSSRYSGKGSWRSSR